MRTWTTLAITVLLVVAGGCAPNPPPVPDSTVDTVPDSLMLEMVQDAGRPATPPPPLPSSKLEVPKLTPLVLAPAEGLSVEATAGGWSVTATKEALDGLSEPDRYGPYGLFWAAGEQALFRWRWGKSFDLMLMDLKTGALSKVKGYTDVLGVSPDGRYATFLGTNGVSALVDMATHRQALTPPRDVYRANWLSPDFVILTWQHSGLADMRAGVIYALPDDIRQAKMLGDQFCYATYANSNSWSRPVVQCVNPSGTDRRTVLAADDNQYAWNSMWVFEPDPSGRRLAFVYQSPAAPKQTSFRWGAVAEATPPQWPHGDGDTIAVYDAPTGTVSRYRLPGVYHVFDAIMSPGGEYLGLSMGPRRKDEQPGGDLIGDFWVLEVATGRLQRVLPFDEKTWAHVLSVQPDGSLLTYGPSSAGNVYKVELRAYGKERTMLMDGVRILFASEPTATESDLHPMAAAAIAGGKLYIYGRDGSQNTWAWPAGTPAAHVSADSQHQWAAVQQTTDQGQTGQIVFLHK